MSEDDPQPQLQNTTELLPLFMPPAVVIPLGTLIGVCMILGVPVKFVFFRYLGKGHLFGSINRMIFFEQAVNSLFLLALGLQLLVLTLPFPIGKAGCLSLEFLIFLAGIHRAIGSFGMAIMRLGRYFTIFDYNDTADNFRVM